MVQVTWQFIINLRQVIASNSQKEKKSLKREHNVNVSDDKLEKIVADWEINSTWFH